MQQEISIGLGDLIRFIWRGLLLSLLVAGVAAFIVYRVSQSEDKVYESQSTVLAAQTNPEFGLGGVTLFTAPPLDVSAYRSAALSDPVIIDALTAMGVTEIGQTQIKQLRNKLNVRTEDTKTSSLLYVQVQDETPEGASEKANAMARAIVDWDKKRALESLSVLIVSLEEQIEALNEQIRSLQASGAPTDQVDGRITLRAQKQENLSFARTLSASATGLLSVLQPASPSSNPVSPRPVFNATLAFMLGLLATYGLLLLRNALDTRLRSVEDLANVSGLPVLAEFPKLQRDNRHLPREASSYLRTNLLFSTADVHPKVFLVTSAQSEEGKSSVSLSLAESFVRNGYQTLLIDADLRKPVIASEYKISPINQPSLEECLRNPYGSFKAAVVAISPKQHLYVMPTFHPAPQASELLSRSFRDCLEKWRQEYDVIIIDSAPVLAVADALTISPFCTGTLLVTNQQKTDRRQVRVTVDLLKRIGVRMLGIAATHVNKEAGHGSRYGYGYGYGMINDQDTKATAMDAPATSVTRANRRSDQPIR